MIDAGEWEKGDLITWEGIKGEAVSSEKEAREGGRATGGARGHCALQQTQGPER